MRWWPEGAAGQAGCGLGLGLSGARASTVKDSLAVGVQHTKGVSEPGWVEKGWGGGVGCTCTMLLMRDRAIRGVTNDLMRDRAIGVLLMRDRAIGCY